MDVYCKRCGEPWDFYWVQHGERFWRGEGCPACYGKEPCYSRFPCEECLDSELVGFPVCRASRSKKLAQRPFRAELTAALHGSLGDDLDGLAAMLDDAESLLGSDFFWK